MADPLSVAGLVTGVISLGLQVAGGLIEYLDAVKGRTEELNSTKQKATEMKDLLLTVKDLLPQLERRWPASATVITRHVKSCDSELSALHVLLSELSQPASSGSAIRDKFAEHKKKLTYPFNRSHITRLEERLTKVNNALQTALQVTDLNISTTSASRIDQIYDLVLSLSQSQVTQTQSTSFTATLRSSGQAAPMGSMVQLDSVETAVSLASKPSLLSSSIETVERYNVEQAPCSDISRICSCPHSRKTSYRQSRWGYLSLSYGTSSTRKHLPDCPFSQFDGETRATKLTVEYSGLRRMLQTAFAISLISTQGAGGRSIGPNFTYYPTVDERAAPAFRILELTHYMNLWGYKNERNITSTLRTLQYCFDSIFILYSQKRASPKDIDSVGQSLMHLVVEVLSRALWRYYSASQFALSTITKLVACGVPVTTYDNYERTPFYRVIDDFYLGREIWIAKLLLPAEPDIPIVRTDFDSANSSLRAWLLDSEIAEASGCGPLSLAARAGDNRWVQDLLKRYPQSLEEVNTLGYTPAHFAIKHPSCLQLILDAGGPSMLEKVNCKRQTPLTCACISGDRTSVQILLAADSSIAITALQFLRRPYMDDVLVSLKQHRDELKALALQYLTKVEAKSFGLHENKVLDGNAFEVQKLLRRKNITLPSRLYVGDEDAFTSSYLECYSVEVYDKLWDLGFSDVNYIGQDGQVPLMLLWWGDYYYYPAMRWLTEHGADYWTPFSERSDSNVITASVTPAHFMFHTVADRLRVMRDIRDSDSKTDDEESEDSDEELEYIDEELGWIVEKLMRVRTSDTCSCLCFVGGCTPWKAFFDCGRYDYPLPSPEKLARQRLSSLRTLHTSLDQDDLKAALRRMTFDALGLTHTCCNFDKNPKNYQKSLRTPQEVDEINAEQSTLLTLFADLLNELNQIADEDRGGIPLMVKDPEEFWMHRWLPRITETLDKLDGDDLTAEERSAAEAVGVVWGPRPAPKVWEMPKYTPDYVMKEVEKIMSEQIQ
ncbi:hypothetical protein F4678DRAFT_418816 [Xylaria arbuscula]|nr:hypothetical protein F4678DRAFT_418816 [Xylaria arbuscula]